jgi:ABC-type uncharacterized transport system permease subunit
MPKYPRHSEGKKFAVRLLVIAVAVLVLGFVVWAVEHHPMTLLVGMVAGLLVSNYIVVERRTV